MINLLDFVLVKKSQCESVLKTLEKIGKENPNLRGFMIIPEKNNRGDYGYTDIYSYKGNEFLLISFDGARIDTKYYLSPDIKEVLKLIKTDSQKHL